MTCTLGYYNVRLKRAWLSNDKRKFKNSGPFRRSYSMQPCCKKMFNNMEDSF